jgi:4-carboxymuconolactone decarboxylase
MSRLPLLHPDELGTDQRQVYEAIAGGRRAAEPQHFLLCHTDGSLTGPFNALVHAPGVGGRVSALGESIRFDTSLTDREREIAILAVAVVREAAYEWYAHERVGRAVGLTDDEIDAVRHGAAPGEAGEREVAVHSVAAALAAGRWLDDEVYLEAVDRLGERALVELAVLVGYYGLLATLLDAFAVGVPEGDDPFGSPGSR